MIVPVPDPAVLVVDRDPEMPAGRMVGARRDHGDARHDPLRDAPIIPAAFGIAAGTDQKAARAFDHFEMRPRVAEIVLVTLGTAMQWIDFKFATMEPRGVA